MANGRDDAFADTGKDSGFARAADQAVEARADRHAGLYFQADAVFGDASDAGFATIDQWLARDRTTQDLGIDVAVNGVTDIATGQIALLDAGLR